MGLQITGSFIDGFENTQSDYYARIHFYSVDKHFGILNCTMAHFTNKEDAEDFSPTYQEDHNSVDNTGMYGWPYYLPSQSDALPIPLNFNLTEDETVSEIQYSSSYQDEVVEYIDFDDDGNEIVSERIEPVEVVTSASVDVIKSKINLDLITGSVYEYAYQKVKEYYTGIYGVNNVNDN
jgi:hypothetical protein